MKHFNFLRIIVLTIFACIGFSKNAQACTGIFLKAKDGSKIIARTCEWGSYDLKSKYVVVPRGYAETAYTPTGMNGIHFVAKYGYVGITAIEDSFILEGMNEAGLVAELFFFPKYGKYEEYCEDYNPTTILDVQLISWILSKFSTIDEMLEEFKNLHIVSYEKGFETAHWNIADTLGRRIVIEIIDGKPRIYENNIGVLTNAPQFDWHLLNLNNYVNLFAGAAPSKEIVPGVKLSPFGAGSGTLGLPGDVTPPSRFVRIAFYKAYSRPRENGHETVLQAFQILNNFDIPIGIEFEKSEEVPDFLSATQWTVANDQKNLRFYYKTEWNYTIRCIDLRAINFDKVKYRASPLDEIRDQPIEYIKVK